MLPPPDRRIERTPARVPRNTPSRLTASTRRQSTKAVSATGLTRAIPAQLTRTCNRPHDCSASPIAASHPDSDVTSRGWPRAVPPAARIASAVPAIPGSSRSATTTKPPSRASIRAVARPMPEAAPVTRAT